MVADKIPPRDFQVRKFGRVRIQCKYFNLKLKKKILHFLKIYEVFHELNVNKNNGIIWQEKYIEKWKQR